MTNRTNAFGQGLLIGSALGIGISMINPDNLNKVKKTVTKTARRMKLNRMIDNITDNITDMF